MQGNLRRKEAVPEQLEKLLTSKWCSWREIENCLKENKIKISVVSLLRILDNTCRFAIDDKNKTYKLITDDDFEKVTK